MIDMQSEQLLSLADATKILPRRRRGARPHVATLFRWTNNGVRGVFLDYLMVGATRCTSIEALQRFFDALTEREEAKLRAIITPPPRRWTVTRRKQIEAAKRKLAAAGI